MTDAAAGIEASVRNALAQYAAEDANAAWLLCDRHPEGAVAVTLLDEDLTSRNVTFGELRVLSERGAAGLARLGVGPGDRVATLMGKSIELVATMIATWRLGAVYVPLFTAFGPQAIAMRLSETEAKVVVVDPDQRPKLDPGPDVPTDGGWRIVLNGEPGPDATDHALADLLQNEPHRTAHTGGGAWPLAHMLTSGTTGRPKGVIHPLAYVAGWHIYLDHGMDVRDDDMYWSAADPGWAYGLYSAIVAPLAMGRRTHLARGTFSAERTLRILADRAITNFAAAPTIYRALRTFDGEMPTGIRLRCASSAGEPLTPEVNDWAAETLGAVVHDHFGQTELGMCVGNHQHPALRRTPKAGSMGQALPGWSVAVLGEDDERPAPRGTLGRLAIDVAGSPLMTFHGYQRVSDSVGKFVGGGRWYLTGDAARQDEGGDLFFSSRDDDVIIMAGYRIGPYDVESVLAQHEAVAECAVVAAPDAARGEVVEAFVVTRAPHEPSEQLARELQRLVKERYAAYAYPRRIHFVTELPKTESGKVQRVVLRRRRACMEGDASIRG